MTLFNEWDSLASRLQNHFEEAVYFLPFKFPEISGTHLTDHGRITG